MLLDTNIVSYFVRRDTRAAVYEPYLRGQTLFISFMTVAELYKWPFVRNSETKRITELMQHLRNYVGLPYDDALAWTWAELVGKRCIRKPMSLPDSWIAATALRHGMPLVMHNPKHFSDIPGLKLITV